jgi:hypothetical protein
VSAAGGDPRAAAGWTREEYQRIRVAVMEARKEAKGRGVLGHEDRMDPALREALQAHFETVRANVVVYRRHAAALGPTIAALEEATGQRY